MSYLSDIYKAERRQSSASAIYRQPASRPAPIRLYDGTPPKTLTDYASAPRASKWDQPTLKLSDAGYTQKLRPLLRHLAEILPPEEFESIVQQFQAAEARVNGGQTHADLRASLDARTSGTGVDGMGTPQERASALGSRFGGRELEHSGHVLPPSVPGSVSLSMLARVPKKDGPAMPVRPAIPYGSSGEGWL